MSKDLGVNALATWQERYPEKFADLDPIFSHIRRGDRIFVASGCGEPQYLVQALTNFVETHPKAFFDAEIIHVYSFGIAPYTNAKFKRNFRHNSFFIGNNTRDPVNAGAADYTPISLSDVPALLYRGLIRIDVALVQTSPPDEHGYMSLGVSVDMVKAATEVSKLIIAQVNHEMPRIHGDGFIHIDDVNFIVPHDEPLLEVSGKTPSGVSDRIGNFVARLIQDGDTIQVGFGSLPNAIMANLYGKKHLGVHTELLSDGLVDLIKAGVIDNSRKTLGRGKTVAAFAMGKRETYRFLHDNPSVLFRTIDFTNNPMNIARLDNIVAIKEASGDLEQISVICAGAPEGFTVYSGEDMLTLPMLAVGCVGVISVASHLAGKQIAEMIRQFQAGDVAAAARTHQSLIPIVKACFLASGNPPCVKRGLEIIGFPVGGLRLPLVPASDSDAAIIRQACEGLGLV